MISSLAAGFVVGTNQKNSSLPLVWSIGNKPAYDSPMSKWTSGSAEPLTAKGFVALVRYEAVECLDESVEADPGELFRLRRSYLACFREVPASASSRRETKTRRALEISMIEGRQGNSKTEAKPKQRGRGRTNKRCLKVPMLVTWPVFMQIGLPLHR
jgi:hypothetical protein